jgi:parvulin-like peptidyl-prolyl isomerase
MKRMWTPKLVGVVVLAAVSVQAGCGSLTTYAAKVNGTPISQQDLQGELEAIQGNERYLEQVELGIAQHGGGRVRGEGQGTFDTVFVARVLNVRIGYELIRQELRRRKLKVGAEDLVQARQEAVESAGGPELFQAFPTPYREELVRRRAEVAVLQRALGDQEIDPAEVQAYFEQNPAQFSQVCARHILVDTQQKAAELKGRIAGGEDFAAVARAESKDNQGEGGGSAGQGGALGCITQEESDQLVREFADAMTGLQPGQLSDPVQTQFGFHIIEVTERRSQSLEEATPQIRQRLEQQSAGVIGEFVQQAMATAKVVVNPRYGRFVNVDGQAGVRAPQELSRARGAEAPAPPPEQ